MATTQRPRANTIFDFAYFPSSRVLAGASSRAPPVRSWSTKFQLPELVPLLLDSPTDWKFVDEQGVEDPYGVLCKYVQYSFAYIVETQPDKLKGTAGGQWVVFDTRLTSSFGLLLEPIYMLFQKNEHQNQQPWFFKKWCVGWGAVLRETNFTNHTQDPYGSDPPPPFSTEMSSNELPVDWKEFIPERAFARNTYHILEDNIERLRQVWRDASQEVPSDADIARSFSQALDWACNPRLNPLRMLPQLYRPGGLGRGGNGWVRQLLMPIHLRGGPAADIALAIDIRRNPDRDGAWYYYASTVLSLGQAYVNARLVHSVESPWLRNASSTTPALTTFSSTAAPTASSTAPTPTIDELQQSLEEFELVGAPSDDVVEGRDEAVPSPAPTGTDAAGSAQAVWPPSVGALRMCRWRAGGRLQEATVVRVDNGMNVFVSFPGYEDTWEISMDNVRVGETAQPRGRG